MMLESEKVTAIKQYLPWVIAMALLMEQLDTTIVNTAVPTMAAHFHVTPLSLKAAVISYTLSFAVCIPISGWIADRFGSQRVFSMAVILFTVSSLLCGLSINLPMLIALRIPQGIGAAMMMPVGRLTIVRTFPRSELLTALNFVTIPALIGPMLGPTVGGLIVHWLSWREIFFVNVPIGLLAWFVSHRYMPDYYGDKPRSLDIVGLLLFGTGIAFLSWLFAELNEHNASMAFVEVLLALSLTLLTTYVWHAKRVPQPLLRLSLFKVRTFRVSLLGGFITRLGIGGLPFLLPLLYQIGLGLPAWQSGLLMMPTAAAAMGMRMISARIIKRYGYRQVLMINTILISGTTSLFSLVSTHTPILIILLIAMGQGFFSTLQFSCANSIAYSDIVDQDSSMASTIVSSFQQMSMSFGLTFGALITDWYLGGMLQNNRDAVVHALHHAFLTLGGLTLMSSLFFLSLHPNDGRNVSGCER